MAVDLQDKNPTEHDGVYDKEHIGELEKGFAAPSATDKDLPEGHPSRKSVSANGLKDAETSAGSGGSTGGGGFVGDSFSGGTGSANPAGDSAEVSDSIGDGYKNEGSNTKARFWTRKRATRSGILGGGLIGGAFLLFSISSGPLQFIHLAQLMQKFHFSNNEEFANGRTSRYLYHRLRSDGSRGHAKMRTRLGAVGNRIADKMELQLNKNGLRSVYHPTEGTLIGYQRLSPEDFNTIDEYRSAMRRADDTFANMRADVDVDTKPASQVSGIGPNGPLGSGDVTTLPQGLKGSVRNRRKFARSMTRTLDLNNIAAAVGFRQTAKRGGIDMHFLRAADTRLNEAKANLREKIMKSLRDKVKRGVKPADEVNLADGAEDGDERTKQASAETESSARGTRSDSTTDKPKAKTEASSKLRGAAPAAAIGAAGIGVLCAARAISENVDEVKHANVVLPLMRLGGTFVSVGNQTMSGQDISLEQLEVLNENLYDTSKDLGWDSAQSIQAELGQPQTGPDIPETAKPKVGQKPTVLEIVDTIFRKARVAGDAVCSTAGQWVLTIITGQVVTDVVMEIAGRAASAAGVNPIDAFVGWIVDTIAGDEIDTSAKGPDLGNMINYGARLAGNEQAISMGGAKLSGQDVAKLDADSRGIQMEEFRQKSWLARTFDLNEPNSMLAKVAFENQSLTSVRAATSDMARLPNTLFTVVGRSFSSLFTPRLQAAVDYDYGFDEYGFTLEEQEYDWLDDPYENARVVEEDIGLETLTEQYGDCFSTKIKLQGDDYTLDGSEVKRYKDIEELGDKCHDRSNVNLTRYRFYLADMITSTSLACYEGENEACQKIGFGSGSAAGSSAPTQTGLESPPNIGPEIRDGYFKMPDAVAGEFEFNGNTPPGDRCGSKTLVDVVYTVSKRWYAKYPNNRIRVGDLNAAAGHASHKNGVDVDIFTVGNLAANTSGNAEASKELGRLFADTGTVKVIFYNDGSVQNDFNSYAQSKGMPARMQDWPGHADHFHVRLLDNFRLTQSLGCPG